MLVIFDVEGVLFDAEYLPLLGEKINKEDEIWEITKKGIQGAINWEEGLHTRVNALKGMDFEICKEVANSLPIMTGAKEACGILKAAGWKLMAISGGFSIMTERLQKELDLDSDKAKSAMLEIKEWGENKEDIVVVVDGANDITLFDICGLGIAFRAQDKVKDLANVILEEKDLSGILGIINKHFNLTLETPTLA